MGNRNRFREAHPSGALLEGLRYPRYGLLSGEAFEEVVRHLVDVSDVDGEG